MEHKLKDKLKTLPRSPGVYFHKSKSGEIIYVGKAAVLKNRVRQYFQSQRDMDAKTRALVSEIYDTDWVETESEIDALFLESEMVKRYMPRYNILLRDDKSQLFVRIDMKSAWPYVCFTRNPADDGADYYGPYYNGFAVKKALRYLRRIFPHYVKPRKIDERPSLYAHIGLDPAPGMTSDEYKATLRKLIRYMQGGRKALARDLEKEMKQAAKLHDFENATILRNRLRDLHELQHRIMFGDREFLDISKDRALSDLKTLFGLSKVPARIEGYDISHHGGTDVVASMVVFTNGVSDRANYRKFKMARQQNDDYANMYETLTRRLSEKNLKGWGVPDLIVIDGGKGQLDAAIRAAEHCSVNIPMISIAKREEEIIVHPTRSHIDAERLNQLMKQPETGVSVLRSGEYLVVNLHAGQLNAGSHSGNLRARADEISDRALGGGSAGVNLLHGSTGGAGPSSYNRGGSAGVNLFHGSTGGARPSLNNSDVVKLFQRIRDESHRFAVSYHSTLKRQRQTASSLEDIPGVGPATRRKLIRTFGSLRGVRQATSEQLTAAVGRAKAETLAKYLAS